MAKKRKRKHIERMIDRTEDVRVTGPDHDLVWIDFECDEGRLTVCMKAAEVTHLNAKVAQQSRGQRRPMALAAS